MKNLNNNFFYKIKGDNKTFIPLTLSFILTLLVFSFYKPTINKKMSKNIDKETIKQLQSELENCKKERDRYKFLWETLIIQSEEIIAELEYKLKNKN